MKYDDRHKRVIEQLLIHGVLSWKQLQGKAKLRRCDDEFGLVILDLLLGKKLDSKWTDETRYFRIKRQVEFEARERLKKAA